MKRHHLKYNIRGTNKSQGLGRTTLHMLNAGINNDRKYTM